MCRRRKQRRHIIQTGESGGSRAFCRCSCFGRYLPWVSRAPALIFASTENGASRRDSGGQCYHAWLDANHGVGNAKSKWYAHAVGQKLGNILRLYTHVANSDSQEAMKRLSNGETKSHH